MGKKSEEKKSFKLYNDYKKHFDQMTDEDAGKVIKAILAYVNFEDFPELEGAAGMAFSFIEAQLDRDRMAYDRKCETNKANGLKGGRPPKKNEEDAPQKAEPKETEGNPEKPNGSFGFPEEQEGTGKEDKKPNKTEYPEGFKRFWEIYPRNVDKKACYRQYSARIKDGYSPEELEAAARAYKAECERKRTPQEYIKHGKTFLGVSGAFEEYLPKGAGAENKQDDGYGEVDFRDFI